MIGNLKRLREAASLTGLVAALWFALAIAVVGWLTPNYSHVGQYVSELGADGAPYSFIMNWFGIVPFGLLICCFAACLFTQLQPGLLGKLLGAMLFLVGIGFVLAGGYSCDAGCSFVGMSRSAVIHNMSAMSAFLGAILVGVLHVIYQCRIGVARGAICMSMFFTLSMVAAFAGLVVAGPLSTLIGLIQRCFLAAFCLWLVFSSWQEFQQQVGRRP